MAVLGKHLTLTRRGALRGILSVPFASSPLIGCSDAHTGELSPAFENAIDIHCHVFNGADLPIRGFLKHSFFEAQESGLFKPPTSFLAFLGNLLGHSAPSAVQEIRRLSASPEAAGAMELDGNRKRQFEADLAEAIGDLERAAAGAAMETGDVTAPPTREEAQELLRAFDQLIAEGGAAPPLDRDVPRAKLRAEALSRGLERRKTDAGPGDRALSLTDTSIWRGLEFARAVLNWRAANVQTYLRQFGGPGRVGLITPAVVDFENWVGSGPAADSALSRQVEVMSQLSRAETGIALHAFAPYDPLRDVLSGGNESFELARMAVEELGHVGVKMYPPMGFFPADNTGNGPVFAQEIRRHLTNRALAEALDGALNRLYTWASDPSRSVPILAHARDSYGGRPNYAKRARPRGWAAAIADHQNLNVALAHFGDFHPASDNDVWEDDLPDLFDAADGVYADLSYMGAAMHQPSAEKARAAALLRAYAAPGRRERLLFGSDWLFIALARGNKSYLSGLDAQLVRAGFDEPSRRGVFRENAVRFLGISQGKPGRERLTRFYQRHGLDLERLSNVADGAAAPPPE